MKRDQSKLGKVGLVVLLVVVAAVQTGCSMTGATTVERPPVAPYQGPKIGIAVGDFQNLSGVEVEEYTTGTTVQTGSDAVDPVRNHGVRDPFGYGMRRQLITALTHTGVFSVNLSEDNVRYRIEGAITEYEPSQASLAGGYGASDREAPPSDPTVSPGGVFSQILHDNALGLFGKQDHVAMDVMIVDLDTGAVVATEKFEASPKDLGAALNLMPGLAGDSDLIDVGGQVQTPMQKAVRACMTLAAAWASDELRVRQVASR